MKLQTILSAFVLVAASATAYAADAEKAPAAEVKAAQPKAAKPHSHVQEKTGVSQTAPTAPAAGKKNPAQDKSKHYHPRDMK